MKMPVVSIIIPTYNRAHTLQRAIDSVLEQSYRDFELLVIDDGSTDATRSLVEKIKDPRLNYIALEKNQGASKARNVGIQKARGEFIAFQDSDDQWLPNKLECQMAVMAEHPEAAMVFCSLSRIDPLTGRKERIPESLAPRDKPTFLKQLLARNFIWTQTWLVKASVLKGGYLFNEAIVWGEDWDLALRIAKKYELVHIDESLVRAYITAGSLLSQVARRGEDLKIMLETHSELLQEYPHILSEYYRGIAISNRVRQGGSYWEGCYWASKALWLNLSCYRSWLTLVLAIAGPAGRFLEKQLR